MLKKLKKQTQLDLKTKKTQTLSNDLMSLIGEGSYDDCDRILGAYNFTLHFRHYDSKKDF